MRSRRIATSSTDEHLSDRVEAEGPLLGGNPERREEAEDAHPAPDCEDPPILQGLEVRCRLLLEFDPDHETEPPDLADDGGVEGAQSFDDLRAELLRPLPQPLPG